MIFRDGEVWVFSISENQVKGSCSRELSILCFYSITKLARETEVKYMKRDFSNINTLNMCLMQNRAKYDNEREEMRVIV